MKINLFYFFLLFLLTTKIVAQTTTDTVFVYDTIIVHEIKTVYDTVKVYETVKEEDSDIFFSKNNTLQNAVLAIDTASSKAQLILFNKKNTATISINSIIVSENLNNSDTMKKKMVTLAAAALLAQTNVAQENKSTPVSVDTSKAFKTAFSIETIIFQNKKHPDKTYEVTLPATQYIRFNSKEEMRTYNIDNISRPIEASGTLSAIITHMDDSVITIKYNRKIMNMGKTMFDNKSLRVYYEQIGKIRKDRSLSDEEKENLYFRLTYTDSVTIPLKSVKSIRFSRFNNKKKTFYNRNFGFNEKLKIDFYRVTALATGGILLGAGIAAGGTPVLFPILFSIVAVYDVALWCDMLGNLISAKRIKLKKWELKTK